MARKGYLGARRFWAVSAAGLFVWLAVGMLCLFFGQFEMGPARVIAALRGAGAGLDADIVLMQRLPRVLLGLLAGGSLAVVGASFQGLLRNPLATPHTLGVSAGGALGAVVGISLGLSAFRVGPFTPVQICALAGALVNVGIIYLLASGRRAFSPLKLLLAGVTLGLISSAMIMFVRFVSEPQKLVMVDRWLMGGLDVQGYRSLAAVLPLLAPALVLLLLGANAMNQLSMGQDLAAGRGVDVRGVQVEVFLAGSVLTAAVVSVAGPIGFIGLIVPHLLRGVLGPDHRLLLPQCFFVGGAFLALADTVARTAFAPSELPVGVLTAMLGGPFFLVLLLTRPQYR